MRTLSAILSAVLLTVASVGVASAQTSAQARTTSHGGRWAHFAQRVDHNHNGQVELAEVPVGLRARLVSADSNHDGVIAREEFQAMRQSGRAQMDTNHDGRVSPEERTVARDTRFAVRFAQMDTNHDNVLTQNEVGPQWNRIARADTDRNGQVTRTELQTARRAFHQHRGHGRRG